MVIASQYWIHNYITNSWCIVHGCTKTIIWCFTNVVGILNYFPKGNIEIRHNFVWHIILIGSLPKPVPIGIFLCANLSWNCSFRHTRTHASEVQIRRDPMALVLERCCNSPAVLFGCPITLNIDWFNIRSGKNLIKFTYCIKFSLNRYEPFWN